jgi:chaperonin GroES
MSVSFIALHDRVVISRGEGDEPAGNGLIIADGAKEKTQDGDIVSVGKCGSCDDGERIAMKAGDLILFAKWSGSEIRSQSADLPIMKESGILSVMAWDRPPSHQP